METTTLINGLEMPTKAQSAMNENAILYWAMAHGIRHFVDYIREEPFDPVLYHYNLALLPLEPHGNLDIVRKRHYDRKIKREHLFYTLVFAKPIEDVEDMDAFVEKINGFWLKKYLIRVKSKHLESMLLDSDVQDLADKDDYPTQYKKRLIIWKYMEGLYKDGKVLSIGVSNYSLEELKFVYDNSEIPPMVLKVRYFPTSLNKELIDFCKEKHIQILADYPVMRRTIIDMPGINKMCEKYQVTGHLLMRQYLKQRAIVPVTNMITRVPKPSPEDPQFVIAEEDLQFLENLGDMYDPEWNPYFKPESYDLYKMWQWRALSEEIAERRGGPNWKGTHLY